MSLPNAFVTLLTTPSYLPGALVLLHSLHDLHPSPRDFKIVCLVTPETVDAKTIGELRRSGYDLVIGVEPIGSGVPGKSALALMGRPDLNLALTKLHLFRLHNLFSTLIYLDADVLPIRPLSSLFESTAPHVLSACPDTGWPDCFNSGVMVIRPRESDWEGMRRMLKNGEGDDGIYASNGSFDGADQGLLNEWFSPEGEGGDWNRLPFTYVQDMCEADDRYNVTPTAAYQYAPAYKRYGHKINAVHFIGPNKPWSNLGGRPAGMGVTKGKENVFDFYDRHVRPTSAHEPDVSRRFSVPEHQAVWNQPASVAGAPHQPEDRLDLDQLKNAAIWGIQAAGQYTSMPLDGRVDLIMPKPKRVTFAPDPTHSDHAQPEPPAQPTAASPTTQDSPVHAVTPLPQSFEQQMDQPSTWDAQRSAPPKTSGPEMAAGIGAYYAPAWEQPPAQQSSWYQAPPPQAEPYYPHIPDNVRNDQWYGQWTNSEPDYQAVQPVFPWEASQTQHHQTARVFPKESAPPRKHRHQLSVNVQSPTPPEATPTRRRSPSPPPAPPPPPKSMAEAMASYTNAWDHDPAIQNYISIITGKPIARPGHGPSHGRNTSIDVKSIPGTPRSTSYVRATDPSDASEYGDDEDESDSLDDPGASPIIGTGSVEHFGEPFPMGRYPSNPKYRDRPAQTEKTQMMDATVQAQPGGGASPVVRMVELPRMTSTGSGPSAPSKTRRTSSGASSMGKKNVPAPITPVHGNQKPGSSSSETTPRQNIVTPPSDSVARLSRPGGPQSTNSASFIPTRNTLKNNFDLKGAQVGTGAGSGKALRTFDPSTDVDARRRETQDVLTRFMSAGSFSRGENNGGGNGNGSGSGTGSGNGNGSK